MVIGFFAATAYFESTVNSASKAVGEEQVSEIDAKAQIAAAQEEARQWKSRLLAEQYNSGNERQAAEDQCKQKIMDAVGAIARVNAQSRNANAYVPASGGITPGEHVVPVTNGALTVNAGSYSWYTFVVPVNATAVSVTGRFTASGGAGNDINVYVLDEDGFVNFKNGHPSATYYNSGQVTQAEIQSVLPNKSATYYLVFDNRFSAITPKAIEVGAVLRYTQ